MPRNETILSVFVASPSDLSEERDLLPSIIDKINLMHARRQRVRFELLMWEREVSPAIGKDTQAVINAQIPQDYDVFIGIIWNRIGTATSRAESGTIEEFELAKARYDEDPNSVRLMLYFKDAPPSSMEDFDTDQYTSAKNFRSEVEKAGRIFYRKFVEADSFANHVQLDLTKLICDWVGQEPSDVPRDEAVNKDSVCVAKSDAFDGVGATELDDEGIIDLEEVFEDEMQALYAVLERMGEAIKQVGSSTAGRAGEIQSLGIPKDANDLSVHERQKLRADTKRILKRTANDMNGFVAQMKQELPLFRQHLDRGIEVFTKAVPIYIEIHEDEDREELKMNINTMLEAMVGMVGSMEELHGAVHGLPRLSTALVQSRREMEKVLQEVIGITRGGITSLEQVLSIIS